MKILVILFMLSISSSCYIVPPGCHKLYFNYRCRVLLAAEQRNKINHYEQSSSKINESRNDNQTRSDIASEKSTSENEEEDTVYLNKNGFLTNDTNTGTNMENKNLIEKDNQSTNRNKQLEEDYEVTQNPKFHLGDESSGNKNEEEKPLPNGNYFAEQDNDESDNGLNLENNSFMQKALNGENVNSENNGFVKENQIDISKRNELNKYKKITDKNEVNLNIYLNGGSRSNCENATVPAKSVVVNINFDGK
ncbi:unnamed protein product [Caenorhabditis angaria]|uniref:Uncharacterized protein n=1 Tax=Caenorhabditis angaria TaxID=860376 RepID=A0A9P1N831_9PELO|nr:unnamed protein product [Caenorhabditis angaria]